MGVFHEGLYYPTIRSEVEAARMLVLNGLNVYQGLSLLDPSVHSKCLNIVTLKQREGFYNNNKINNDAYNNALDKVKDQFKDLDDRNMLLICEYDIKKYFKKFISSTSSVYNKDFFNTTEIVSFLESVVFKTILRNQFDMKVLISKL